jgi:hypothetical protein
MADSFGKSYLWGMRSFLFRRVSILTVSASLAAFAQGGSAVITLVMPPPGGEGYTALQTGAALPQGAASSYYNPALLSELGRTTGSQLFLTHSDQDLLPGLGIKNLNQNYWGAALVAADLVPGADMGVGLFRNHVNFGKNVSTDSNGLETGSFDSYETVYGLALGVRLGLPVSAGLAVKYFDSQLAQGIGGGDGGDGAAGWAFDIGLFADPRFSLPQGFARMSVTPSAALVVKNLGPEVSYGTPGQADPIPTTYTAAVALKVEAVDMAEAVFSEDLDQEWTRRSDNWDPTHTNGFSLFFLGYRYSVGWLADRQGNRYEKHTSMAFEIDFHRAYRMVQRFRTGDYSSPSEAMDKGYPFRRTRLLGVPFQANPRLSLGTREIEAQDNGFRDGQNAFFFSVSL